MPTFTQQELEEIRSNTERIERERLKKDADSDEDDFDDDGDGDEKGSSRKRKSAKSKSAAKSRSRSKKSKEHAPLVERLIGFILLLITIAVSYLIMVLN